MRGRQPTRGRDDPATRSDLVLLTGSPMRPLDPCSGVPRAGRAPLHCSRPDSRSPAPSPAPARPGRVDSARPSNEVKVRRAWTQMTRPTDHFQFPADEGNSRPRRAACPAQCGQSECVAAVCHALTSWRKDQLYQRNRRRPGPRCVPAMECVGQLVGPGRRWTSGPIGRRRDGRGRVAIFVRPKDLAEVSVCLARLGHHRIGR